MAVRCSRSERGLGSLLTIRWQDLTARLRSRTYKHLAPIEGLSDRNGRLPLTIRRSRAVFLAGLTRDEMRRLPQFVPLPEAQAMLSSDSGIV
jgi:hypothetical protein